MAATDTLLVTLAELRAADAGRRVAALHDDDDFAAEQLAAAQGMFASWAGYDPFVHAHAQDYYADAGVLTLAGTRYGYVWATARPAFALVTAGVTAASDGARLYYASGPTGPVSYFAGWRGSHHVIAAPGAGQVDLTTLDGLADLDVLPPLVPQEVRAALCRAAVYAALHALSGFEEATETAVGTATTRTVGPVAMNDVNTLIGRRSEVEAMFDLFCGRHRLPHL